MYAASPACLRAPGRTARARWRPGRRRTAADGGAHHLASAVHRPPIEAGHGTGVAVRQRQLPGALIGPHPALRQHSASVRTGRFPSQVVRVPGSRLLCPRKGAGRSSADGVPSAGGSGRRRTRPPQSGALLGLAVSGCPGIGAPSRQTHQRRSSTTRWPIWRAARPLGPTAARLWPIPSWLQTPTVIPCSTLWPAPATAGTMLSSTSTPAPGP